MRTLAIALVALVLSASGSFAFARDDMPKSEIDKLPQDKVQAIKNNCKQEWGDNFDMRLFCEDNQYRALQALIERNK
jgi:hypothetical protein